MACCLRTPLHYLSPNSTHGALAKPAHILKIAHKWTMGYNF